jgi:hypothetical protein
MPDVLANWEVEIRGFCWRPGHAKLVIKSVSKTRQM